MRRREFLAAGTAAALAGRLPARPPAGKDPGLTLVTADPLVLETPDRLLATSRVTPTPALFVRNHHGAKGFEDSQPRPLVGELEFTGLVAGPKRLPLARLAALPRVEVELVLQCSGNFRSQFSKLSPIKGTPWNKGGLGNVRFAGPTLATVFRAAGLEVRPGANYLTAEGADQPEQPGQADYERSVPLGVALERGLLATELNGQPLPAVHGGPVRLVIPGFYGCNQVKWVTRLRLEAAESRSVFQLPDYRTPKRPVRPGEAVRYTVENSDPNFEMRVNSRLLSPADGTTVPAGKPTELKGVAWNDGAAPLTAVEVSADLGKTWRAADLAPEAGPFAFREWTLAVTLPAGRRTVWVRATDALGRTQPASGERFWNPGGYAWNAYETVVLSAD